MTALANLVTGAMNLAGTLTKKVASLFTAPFKQMQTGGWTRALNIEEAKFQLEGLGVTWDKIKDDINYGVQDTAYGLDVAAKAASQLVASGVKVGDSMSHALLAISGVASMTSSSYEEISPIFTAVAGQGKLMTRQLRQLEMRGLNAAAVLGQAMGKSEAAIRDMVTNGEINFNEFSEAMWETFGQHAKDANNTFTGALSNIKAALNKIGAEFATPLMTNAVPVFNSIRLMINAIKANMGEVFKIFAMLTKGVSGKLTKSIDKITDFLKNRFTGVNNLNRALAIMANSLVMIGKTISSAFKEVFNGSAEDKVNNLAEGIEHVAEVLAPTRKGLEGLKTVLKVVFTIIKQITKPIKLIGEYVIGPLVVALKKVVQILLTVVAVVSSLTGETSILPSSNSAL